LILLQSKFINNNITHALIFFFPLCSSSSSNLTFCNFLFNLFIFITINSPILSVVLAEMAQAGAAPASAVFRSAGGEEIAVRKNFPEVFVWSELKAMSKEADK
jgi:hypothetical protein